MASVGVAPSRRALAALGLALLRPWASAQGPEPDAEALDPEVLDFRCERYAPRPAPRRLFWGIMLGDYHFMHLEALFHEAADLVERFLIVEADHTHQGEAAQSLLPGLLAPSGRLGAFADKVVHRVVPLDPAVCRVDTAACEARHRNTVLPTAIEAGMRNGRDVLISGDTDELLTRGMLLTLARCDFGPVPITIPMPFHVFDFRWEWREWRKVVAAPAEFWTLPGQVQVEAARRGSIVKGWPSYEGRHGGWHLSWFGGPHAVRQKLTTYGHAELNRPPFTDLDYILRCIREGQDPVGRGPLERSSNKARPRLLRFSPPFRCWLNAEWCAGEGGPALEIARAAVSSMVGPTGGVAGCLARFVLGGFSSLTRASAALAARESFVALGAERGRCEEVVGSVRPTFLLARFRRRAYLEREAPRSPACGELRARAAQPEVVFGLCVPIACLSDGAGLLAVAHRHYAEVALAGAAVPPLRHEDVDFEEPAPEPRRHGRGARRILVAPGLSPGSPWERRLVIGCLLAPLQPLQDMLHIFLGSLRRAQVSARAVILTSAGSVAEECLKMADAYGADCVLDGGGGDCVDLSARLLASHRALLAAEVLVTGVADAYFQADPFPASRQGDFAMLPSAPSDDAAGCAGCGVAVRAGVCAGGARVSGAAVLGTKPGVLALLRSWGRLRQEAAGSCSEELLLSAWLRSGVLAPGLPKPPAPPAAACAVGPREALRVGAHGGLLGPGGRRCALVLGGRVALRRLAAWAHVPGRGTRRWAVEFPFLCRGWAGNCSVRRAAPGLRLRPPLSRPMNLSAARAACFEG